MPLCNDSSASPSGGCSSAAALESLCLDCNNGLPAIDGITLSLRQAVIWKVWRPNVVCRYGASSGSESGCLLLHPTRPPCPATLNKRGNHHHLSRIFTTSQLTFRVAYRVLSLSHRSLSFKRMSPDGSLCTMGTPC